MSYVDDFLEINANLPRDVIRLFKLVREIDEKAFSKNIKYKLLKPCKIYLK